VVLNDVNYWTFGELLEDIPEDYYGDDPRVMTDYQQKKIQRHYRAGGDDCYMGFLMPWYGTAVRASGFGHPIVKNYKADPAADISRVRTPQEAFGGGCIHAGQMRRALARKGIAHMAGDFIPTDERLKGYYRELLEAMGDQVGLIIVPYVMPAIELHGGRYNECRRDQFELGQKVSTLIEEAITARA
jgi:hypothetical protein